MITRASFLALTLVIAHAAHSSAQARDSANVATVLLTSSVYENTRTIRIYLPPGYHHDRNAHRNYPVLIMADGFAVFSSRSWNAPAILDSLIGAKVIAPVVLVGIDNAASIPGTADPAQARAIEYLPYTDVLEPAITDPRGSRFRA